MPFVLRRVLVLACALVACRGSRADSSAEAPAAALASASVASPVPASASASASASAPVAVVELFTSEGCNSCPPADDALAELVAKHDPRVFPIALHVDYWDELGWPDRFADARFTERQRGYARALGASGMFTPQMIVNGVASMNGADRAGAAAAIARALATDATATIALAVEASGPSIVVRWRVDGAPAAATISVALVERGLASRVKRGENAGRTLRHENVARAFVTLPVGEGSGATMLGARDVDRSRAEVVAFVQRRESSGWPVIGAARAGVAP